MKFLCVFMLLCFVSLNEGFLFKHKNKTTTAASTVTTVAVQTTTTTKIVAKVPAAPRRTSVTRRTTPAPSLPSSGNKDEMIVTKILDGDTIAVKKDLRDMREIRIRFKCVDAPEKSQTPWGPVSLKKLSEWIPVRSRVTLQGANIDQYGRTLAEVIDSKGQNINKKLAELGMGVYYPFQAGCLEYRTINDQAKLKKIGVWSDGKFELPWEYRKRVGIGRYGSSSTTSKPK